MQEWDEIHKSIKQRPFRPRAFFAVHDEEHKWLLSSWLKKNMSGRVLLTDIFNESKGYVGALNYLKSIDCDVVACDISSVLFSWGKDVLQNLIDGAVCDVRQLPFSRASFDHVVSFSTLDHFSQEDFVKSLCEIYRILKPGGRLIITLHNEHNVFQYFQFVRGSPDITFPIETYRLSDARKSLEQCGFTVENQSAIVSVLFPRIITRLCHWAEVNDSLIARLLLRYYLRAGYLFRKTFLKYYLGKFIALCASK